MNKIGINLSNWTNIFDETQYHLFEKVAKLGFTAVEIGVSNFSADTKTVKEQIDKYNLEPVLCAFLTKGRDISNFDEEIRKNTFEYFEQCFKFANEIGAKILCGPLYAGGGKAHFLSDDDKAKEWGYAVNGLRQVASLAKKHGVSLAIEPIHRYRTSVVNNIEQTIKLTQDIGCDNVGIHFDTYHANIEEEDVLSALETALKTGKLLHFHACANNRGPAGEGHLPWAKIFALLKEYNYSGQINQEMFKPGGLDASWVESNDRDEMATKGLKNITNFLNT